MARHLSIGIRIRPRLACLAPSATAAVAAPTDSFPFSGRVLSSAGIGLDSAVAQVADGVLAADRSESFEFFLRPVSESR